MKKFFPLLCGVAFLCACGDDSSSTSADDSFSSPSSSVKISSSSWTPTVLPSEKYDCAVYKCVATDYLNASVEYGELLDERDNQVYRTVKIGEQEWMAQNVNFDIGDATFKNNAHADSSQYGRLYTWYEAVGKSKEECDSSGCALPERVQGICPEGWHLPSKEELETLLSNDKTPSRSLIMAQVGWDENAYAVSSDSVGFSALPTGFYNGAEVERANMSSVIWSSTEYALPDWAYAISIDCYSTGVVVTFPVKGVAGTVRCLKD